jgi:hypothetical protein
VYLATDNALGTTLLIFMLFLLTQVAYGARRGQQTARLGAVHVFETAILEKVCLPTALGCHLNGGGDIGASPFWQLSGKQSA